MTKLKQAAEVWASDKEETHFYYLHRSDIAVEAFMAGARWAFKRAEEEQEERPAIIQEDPTMSADRLTYEPQ